MSAAGAVTWGSAESGVSGPVSALLAFEDGLLAGGRFDYAGDTEANGLARWNGRDVTPQFKSV